MSEISPRLGLPYLLPAQAQKHVTHNEALGLLDVMVQTVITAFDVQTPPPAPDMDQVFAIGNAPTGDWSGAAGGLAQWVGSGWMLVTPRAGWLAWGADGRGLVRWSGTDWLRVNDNLASLGIAATADDYNRLVVSSPSTLLTHAGAGHQVKINKAGLSDSGSILFQTNWSGRAEIGLCGDDALTIKTSTDGSSFSDALKITGVIVSGDAVQSGPGDTAAGKLARADYTLARGQMVGTVSETAGTPTGAVIERGSSAAGSYTRFADGTQICTRQGWTLTTGGDLWTYPIPFATGQTPAVSVQASGQTATPVIVNSGGASASGVTVRAFDTAGAGLAETVDAVAIGRWY